MSDRVVASDGGSLPRFRVATLQACCFHQPPHPLVRDPVTAGGELRAHTTNVGAAVETLVEALDQRGQFVVPEVSR
ncbi:hypothetical protein M3G10_15250 [Dietzia cinnamea]|nr:hypothetical protein [Dietzia cinnamea]MCT1641515.1 hypothetical protein [Dietzia cinnamea]MCT2175659.1 hypothetical protein [Dietzia cinnamea]